MNHHDSSQLEALSSREEPPAWRRAHDDLTRLAKTRAHLNWQEGRSLRSALKTSAHLQLGFAGFAEYIERLFGYSARWTAERQLVGGARAHPRGRARERAPVARGRTDTMISDDERNDIVANLRAVFQRHGLAVDFDK
jgi:hypothetical protein